MDIYIRLNILLENNVITKEVYDKLEKTIIKLKENFNLEITEENGGMFITHLSAALTRINNGELVTTIDKSIMEEIKMQSSYNEAVKISGVIANICNVIFPIEEEVFILTYLCTILV